MTGAVDVVIPTYNACGLITRCLEALDDPALARVTVVDDASTDGTAQEIKRRFPTVSVVEVPEHRGLAYALNRGADAGEAELVLFLNNDVFPRPGAVSRLAEALAEDPAAAAAGGRLVDPGTDHTQDV
jgi:N-acetylglucosaminyl-diphospho-decaprenol L-rhamnosyltransferase